MKSSRILAWALAASLFACGCAEEERYAQPGSSGSGTAPRSPGNRVIYEANVYAFSQEGTFEALERGLPRLRELGVDILWLMPVHPIGLEKRQGTLGSPYAVRDYKALNPDFGTEADFKSLVDACHGLGIELWMDWVANHTAWDNVWVAEHPEYYAEKEGERPYAPEGWPDVVQLDHADPGLCDAMADAMGYWIREFGVDGFRCDAADRIPLDFWRALRAKVDAVKRVTWLSEGWDSDYLEVFDYDYAWQFADALRAFGKTGDAARLADACRELHRNEAYREKGRMVYITNHDLNAYDGTEFDRYGDNVMPLTVLSFTVFDMPLIFNGQEIGMDKSLNFSEHALVPWELTNRRYVELHRMLARLKRSQPALEDGTNRGTLTIHPTTQENVLAFSRNRAGNHVLVLLNLGNYAVRARFGTQGPRGRFRNFEDGAVVDFGPDTGISLRENGYAIFVK